MRQGALGRLSQQPAHGQLLRGVFSRGYGWLWLPLSADTAALRNAVPQLRAQAAQLESDSAEARRLATAPKPQGDTQKNSGTNSEPLAASVETGLLAAGMKDKLRVQALDIGRVQISSEGIGFNEWIALLASLQQTRNARVESARVEPVAGATLVRAQAVLARPPAADKSPAIR